jgi:hypothetical protein
MNEDIFWIASGRGANSKKTVLSPNGHDRVRPIASRFSTKHVIKRGGDAPLQI